MKRRGKRRRFLPRPRKQAALPGGGRNQTPNCHPAPEFDRPRPRPEPAGPSEGVGGRPGSSEGRKPEAGGERCPGHRPRPHLRGPGPQRGRRRRQRAPHSAGLGGPGAHGRGAAEVDAAPRTGRRARCRAGPPVNRRGAPPARLAPFVVVLRSEQLIGRSARPRAAPGPTAPIGGAGARGPPRERLSPTHVTWRPARRALKLETSPGNKSRERSAEERARGRKGEKGVQGVWL